MFIFVTVAGQAFIGQMRGGELGVIGGLAALRAPQILPWGISALLFENQPLLWVAGAALGLILLHLGRSRGNRNLFRGGVGVIAATLLWIVAAAVVVTPAERLHHDHEVLARAAQNDDVQTIVSFFASDFASPALGIDNPANAKSQIEQRLKSYGIKAIHITDYHVEMDSSGATTRFTVTAETADYPAVPTTWELGWEDVPGADWRIERADLLRIGNQPASELPEGNLK